jgi:fructan beta-fructosidase
MQKISISFLVMVVMLFFACKTAPETEKSSLELYRPQIHFTPDTGWMNDPNGMVYHEGVYHLFYQHNPDSTVWGPMHWGHATSTDLINWERQPIALYPDSLGMIFSGSAIVDEKNTSGFGKDGKMPLVAIFTYHHPEKEKLGKNDHQNQGIAYSLDNGKTWTKFAGNPVLMSPGIRDFRDPKVFWHAEGSKWVMALAAGDRIMFYSSPDLKTWKMESAFGETAGAHGGVWECPDLFPLMYDGKTVWVLIVNLNPGGPNGGSATQYFLGDFDGKTFSPHSTESKWLDYGPDNYAGITWSNTGDRKILIGWMSNWLYANQVPTQKWRSAMTIARELRLKKVNDEIYLACTPVSEIDKMIGKRNLVENVKVQGAVDLTEDFDGIKAPFLLEMELDTANDFQLIFSNSTGEQMVVGYEKASNQYFIDRYKSGEISFYKSFAAKHTAPRISKGGAIKFSLVADVSSLEWFADDGITAMTSIFFNKTGFSKIEIQSVAGVTIKKGGLFSLGGPSL